MKVSGVEEKAQESTPTGRVGSRGVSLESTASARTVLRQQFGGVGRDRKRHQHRFHGGGGGDAAAVAM